MSKGQVVVFEHSFNETVLQVRIADAINATQDGSGYRLQYFVNERPVLREDFRALVAAVGAAAQNFLARALDADNDEGIHDALVDIKDALTHYPSGGPPHGVGIADLLADRGG